MQVGLDLGESGLEFLMVTDVNRGAKHNGINPGNQNTYLMTWEYMECGGS